MNLLFLSMLLGANYTIDPKHSSVHFQVSHMAFSYTKGRFNMVSGHIEWDLKHPQNSAFEIRVQAESIDTNNKKRDEHLRKADFLDTKMYPDIRFQSQQLNVSADGYILIGELSLHGVSKNIEVKLQHIGEGTDAWGGYRVGHQATFTVKRSEYNILHMLSSIGDEVQITVNLESIRKSQD